MILTLASASMIHAEDADDRSTIQAAIESYVAAFNARDAKALAAHWSPDGIYTSRVTGDEITGRDSLQQDFTALFEQIKDSKLEVATQSIDFISPNVALERGTATVVRPQAAPEKTSYQVVHIKRDGKWLIDRITEEDATEPPSRYEQLKSLEWLVGDWVDEDGGSVVKTECQWTKNKNYLLRAFSVSVEDRVSLSGMQLVGWDPAQKQIRSWLFDSDGGFAEGTWREQDGRWLVRTTATLTSGARASSTSILEPRGDDQFVWQKVNRVVDGEILPNIDPVVIVRK
jgi:uncharacterized protein (TIGR02246 family)